MNSFMISLCLGAILAVRGQDPTSVCYPIGFETKYYNIITEDTGVISVDFSKQKFSEVSAITGYRSLHDFVALKSYVIKDDGNRTTCRSYRLQQNQVMYRCLPPYSKLVSNVTGYLHHVSGVRMYIQTWDVETEYGVVNRVVFSVVSGQPYWPIMSQEYGYHGTKNVYIYTNPAPAVSNPNVFTVPEQCVAQNIKTQPVVG